MTILTMMWSMQQTSTWQVCECGCVCNSWFVKFIFYFMYTVLLSVQSTVLSDASHAAEHFNLPLSNMTRYRITQVILMKFLIICQRGKFSKLSISSFQTLRRSFFLRKSFC
jgi:hypothetical protein